MSNRLQMKIRANMMLDNGWPDDHDRIGRAVSRYAGRYGRAA
jgi:hypothetical protein